MAVSYAYRVKNEICGCDKFDKPCCKKAMLYGMLMFSSLYSAKQFKLATGHISTALKCAALAKEAAGEEFNISIMEKVYSVTAEKQSAARLFALFGHTNSEVALHVNYAGFECDACETAFVAGAFLASGTVTSPDKSYRLEFTSPHRHRIQDLALILRDHEINVHITVRGNVNVLYVKDSESIENLLAYMGATSSALQLMSTKVEKNIRNRTNRSVNVETANLKKTLEVAANQIDAIEYLIETGELYSMEKEFADIAALRLANPECSLSQLAVLSSISRSAVNSRLKKLVAEAEKLKERK